jgi:tetratricopeptide (TPR) repeat protein
VTEETKVVWDPIRSAYSKGDCVWAIQEHEAMSKAHPGALVPTDIEVIRGICFGRTGRRQDAIRVLDPLLAGGQAQTVDAQQIQYLVANWLFEEGQLDRAGERYQALLESNRERDRWAELAKLRLEQIRLRRGETGPSPALPPEQAPGAATGAPPREAAPEMAPGERPSFALPPPQAPDPVTRPSGSPAASPATVPAPPDQAPGGKPPEPSAQEVQTARLREAQQLLEAEKYEEAIQAYMRVEGPESEAQARKGIQEAQDRYAEKQRRDAASLVLKAREEGSANRKANLVKALEILQETNKRYPNNKYAPKIQQNIQDVIGQIRAIDPGFRP